MKKVLVLVTVLSLGAAGWVYVRSNLRLKFQALQGKTVKTGRGDLTIPIMAAGIIEPESRTVIKSKASGELIQIVCEAGQLVKEGQVLFKLKEDDERRNVEKAEADVRRAKAAYEASKVKLEQAKEVGIKAAQAQLDQINANLEHAEFRLNKVKRLYTVENASNNDELVATTATYKDLLARKHMAESDLEKAKLAIQAAEQDVAQAEATHKQAETIARDSNERLAETTIRAPKDAMVTQINVAQGEMIQSGTISLMGGTVLMTLADCNNLYVMADVDEADIGTILQLAPHRARPEMNIAGGKLVSQREREAEDDPAGASEQEADVPIATGTPVDIRVESFHDEVFKGVIERIFPEPLSTSSVVTYKVKIRLTSDNRSKLMLGMQADVEFTAQSVENVVLCPHEAIKSGEGDQLGVYVPVPRKDGSPGAEPQFRPCRFGLDNGSYAQVLEGLDEGDEVYTVVPIQQTEDND